MKTQQTSFDSPKAVVGEIDTRAPFQSVRAAVSLFIKGPSISKKADEKKPKQLLTEKVLAKNIELHLARKELNKMKDQLKNADTTKAQALVELERAKRAVEDLTLKLRAMIESKESAIRATENANDKAERFQTVNFTGTPENVGSWKHELDSAREQYAAIMVELDAAKQELRKIQQDFLVCMNAKVSSFQQAEEAECAADANKERSSELSMEIVAVQESISHVNHAAMQAQVEQEQILSEKSTQLQSMKLALEEAEKKLESLRNEFNPELETKLEKMLAETFAEISILRQEMDGARASNLDTVQTVTTDLDDAKAALQKVAEEESSLRNLVDSLKQDIENVRKEHMELKEKEAEAESISGNLHVKLRKSKDELEAALAADSNLNNSSSGDLALTLQKLSLESENARKEAESINRNAEELKKEARMTQIALEDAEKKLQVALKEADEAKVAEAIALDQIKILSERTNASRASASDAPVQVTISSEEYKSLRKKVEELEKLAEMKVSALMGQLEAVKVGESEVMKRLEATQKEIEEMSAAIQEAVKQAEMAESAKQVVEGELRRWREREQMRAMGTASLILSETEMHTKPNLSEAEDDHHKMGRSSVNRRNMWSNISSIFHWKRNQANVGS